MTDRTCRFCRQKKLTLLFPANRVAGGQKRSQDYVCTSSSFGRHGPIVKCQNCQIVYIDEVASQGEISSRYEEISDKTYLAEQEARKATFQKYLRKLEEHCFQKGKLLDIGTNTGLFVKLAINSGWEATGLEPNSWAVNYAKKNYGIALINKPFERETFPPEFFDAVTMWDVIEHFTNPLKEIKTVHRCLKSGGVLAFSTVNPESLLAKIMGTKWSWFMEMHRVFFTPLAARKYLSEVGFKKIVFTPHWRNLSLGYLATRLEAINPTLSQITSKIVSSIRLSSFIVPYYANDLYDCYAFKT